MLTLEKAMADAPELDLEGYPIDGDKIARVRDAGREAADLTIWAIVADETAITHHCDYQTYRGSFFVDPEPPEYCEVQVLNEGDRCRLHEDA